jgi:serine/threonine-protein kinase
VPAGTVVGGKFRIDRVLAEGGMGVVVAATDLHLERPVALKFLRAENGADWECAARFTREAKAAAQLKSEYVAAVLDVGVTDDGMPYIVMEYLEGQSLFQVLRTQGPLDIESAALYTIQVCEGLAEAHSRGILHRDIKPDNLFLLERSPGWRSIKIVDFGISRLSLAEGGDITTGIMMGSPSYMSPEELGAGPSLDHRTDIWSLGATLHELLTGRTAFEPSMLPELVSAIMHRPPVPVRRLRPEVPEELAAVIERCLAKDREARFSSAADLARALLPFAPESARGIAERAATMAPAFAPSVSRQKVARLARLAVAHNDVDADEAHYPGQIAVAGVSFRRQKSRFPNTSARVGNERRSPRGPYVWLARTTPTGHAHRGLVRRSARLAFVLASVGVLLFIAGTTRQRAEPAAPSIVLVSPSVPLRATADPFVETPGAGTLITNLAPHGSIEPALGSEMVSPGLDTQDPSSEPATPIVVHPARAGASPATAEHVPAKRATSPATATAKADEFGILDVPEPSAASPAVPSAAPPESADDPFDLGPQPNEMPSTSVERSHSVARPIEMKNPYREP